MLNAAIELRRLGLLRDLQIPLGESPLPSSSDLSVVVGPVAQMARALCALWSNNLLAGNVLANELLQEVVGNAALYAVRRQQQVFLV